MGSDQSQQPRRPRLAWLHSIPGIVSFIGVLLAAGFSGIYICNNTVCGPEPILDAIDPLEVAHGEEAGLFGKDLNLVFEIYLSGLGRDPIRIYHILENESKLTLAVPWSVPPGEYRVEARWRKPIPLAWSKTLVQVEPKLVVKDEPTPPPPPPCPDDPIVFADLDWNSVRMQNTIAKFIITEGYGCEIDGIEGSATPLFQSLIAGNLHVFLELWLPNYIDE